MVDIKEFDANTIEPSTERYTVETQGGSKIVVIGKPGCFMAETPILTYDGRKIAVENIIPGDIIMGDDSEPRTVLSLCRGSDTMYRIRIRICPDSPIIVNETHIISLVRTHPISSRGELVDIRVCDYMRMTKHVRAKFGWIFTPVRYKHLELAYDPYLAGFFFDNDFSFMKRQFILDVFPRYTDSHIDNIIHYTSMHAVEHNVSKNSISVRAKYIAGVIDSRGIYCQKKARFELIFTVAHVCNVFIDIAKSIGFMARFEKCETMNYFTRNNESCFKCILHVSSITPLPSQVFFNCLSSITVFSDYLVSDFVIDMYYPVKKYPYYGFEITGNKRFLLGDYSVVHNTGKAFAPDTPVRINRDYFIRPNGQRIRADLSTVRRKTGELFMLQQYHILFGHTVEFMANTTYRIDNKSMHTKDMVLLYGTTDYYYIKHETEDIVVAYLDIHDKTVKHNALFSRTDKPISCIVPGDLLYGTQAEHTRVLKTYRGIDAMYRITFSNGRHVVVTKDHVMVVFDRHNCKKYLTARALHDENRLEPNKRYRVPNGSLYFSDVFVTHTRLEGVQKYVGITVSASDSMFECGDIMLHNCFAAGTRVRKMSGTIDVCNVRPDDLLLGPDGTTRTVLATHSGTSSDWYTSRNVRMTGNHTMVLAKDNKVVEVDASDAYTQTEYKTINVDGTTEPLDLKRSFMADTYYGFEVDGDKRIVLEDGTITHNSTLITSLLYEKRHIFPVGIVFSGTEIANGYWGKHFPNSFVYNALDLEVLKNFVKRQQLAIKFKINNPWSIVLLDDCTDDPKIFNNKIINGLFKNGRHLKMLFILAMQHPSDIKSTIRSSVDYVFILREAIPTNRKKLFDYYAPGVPTLSLFCKILDVVTDDYTALVINNTIHTNQWENCMFWYRAKPVPYDFKVGSNQFWMHHHARYDDTKNDFFDF